MRLRGWGWNSPHQPVYAIDIDRRGDRPHESLIFQGFPDIGLATTPILAAFAGFPPGGDLLNEFIFDSFLFSRNVV